MTLLFESYTCFDAPISTKFELTLPFPLDIVNPRLPLATVFDSVTSRLTAVAGLLVRFIGSVLLAETLPLYWALKVSTDLETERSVDLMASFTLFMARTAVGCVTVVLMVTAFSNCVFPTYCSLGALAPFNHKRLFEPPSNSSGVYICKSVVNDLRHGNFICKSEVIYRSKQSMAESTLLLRKLSSNHLKQLFLQQLSQHLQSQLSYSKPWGGGLESC